MYSAFVILSEGKPKQFGKVLNGELREAILAWFQKETESCVIEQVASYGMPVGEEVFETVFWSGRFAEAYGAARVKRMPRLKVKMHLCHDSRAKDGNIRQAVIDRFGGASAIGKKATPGPLYGVSGDVWAALALALTYAEAR